MRRVVAKLLHGAHRVCLGCASLIVPRTQRREWHREWRAELWHVQAACALLHGTKWSSERAVMEFCAGAFKDALCLRRQDENRPVPLATRAGSPRRCVALLAGLAALSYAVALCLPGARTAHWSSPYRDTQRLVLIQEAWSGDDAAPTMEMEQVRAWKRRRQTVFDGFAFYRVRRETLSGGIQGPQNLTVAQGSLNLFEVLGLPVRFAVAEARAADLPEVILSDELWKRRFAGDTHIAGRFIEVAGRTVRVGGVAPSESWKLPGSVDAWVLESDERLRKGGPGFVVAHRTSSAASIQRNERWPLAVGRPDGGMDELVCIPLAELISGPRDVFLFAVFLACLSLPATTSLPLGEYPLNSRRLPRGLRLRRWSFLVGKIALLLPLVYFTSLDLAHLRASFDPASSEYIQLASTFSLCLVGLRWTLRDQRERCPLCLGKLTHEARVGEPSRNFLGWNGVELICVEGHGLLHVPDKQVVAPKRLTLEELKAYNGEDKTKPIYLAIRGVIFDVSRGAACLGEHAHMCGGMRMCLHA